MGEMRDSDWSRRNLLRSDWSGPRVAICTTFAAGQTLISNTKGEFYNKSRKSLQKTFDFKQDRYRTGFENDIHAITNFFETHTLIQFSKKNGYVLTETPFYVA